VAAIRIDVRKTVLLMADFHNESLTQNPLVKEQRMIENAAQVLAAARKAGMFVAYVVVNFRPGFLEISDRNKWFSQRKGSGRVPPADPKALIHPAVLPLESEPVIVKHRVSAFHGTDFEVMLRARDITTLVIMGSATSGVVLSTVRSAADMDYEIIVVEDGCADLVAEVHRVLMEYVFPKQGTVVSAKDMVAAISSAQEQR
jgi:nicotinamidase-related amidase